MARPALLLSLRRKAGLGGTRLAEAGAGALGQCGCLQGAAAQEGCTMSPDVVGTSRGATGTPGHVQVVALRLRGGCLPTRQWPHQPPGTGRGPSWPQSPSAHNRGNRASFTPPPTHFPRAHPAQALLPPALGCSHCPLLLSQPRPVPSTLHSCKAGRASAKCRHGSVIP